MYIFVMNMLLTVQNGTHKVQDVKVGDTGMEFSEWMKCMEYYQYLPNEDKTSTPSTNGNKFLSSKNSRIQELTKDGW